MNKLSIVTLSTCFMLAAGTAGAQDAMKKSDSKVVGGMMKNPTMQECKDHMAMAKKDGMKKSEATAMMDTKCADMMKTDAGMTKSSDSAMPAGGMASAPMKK